MVVLFKLSSLLIRFSDLGSTRQLMSRRHNLRTSSLWRQKINSHEAAEEISPNVSEDRNLEREEVMLRPSLHHQFRKAETAGRTEKSPLVYDLVSLLVYGSYTKAYTNKYTSGKKKRDIRTLLYPHVSSFSSSRSISIIVTEY